ncbi:MAG: phosphotransferase [Chloroflexi bacterium]|nr:phosphotransferase [Chloroflexota bacterium]
MIHTEVLLQGSVQTNYMIHTSRGKFVFRLYKNRTKESVSFERDLLIYLVEHSYPCPAPMKNTQGTYVGLYHHKPYMVFEFLEGHHVEEPNFEHWQQLVEYAARLQKVAQKFHSPYTPHRWNFDSSLCLKLAQTEVTKSNNENSRRKLAWLVSELAALDLPSTLPKGICHCDFRYSNVLFRDDLFVALLDFDDANYTYLQFDLVGLIEYWAWPSVDNILDVKKSPHGRQRVHAAPFTFFGGATAFV